MRKITALILSMICVGAVMAGAADKTEHVVELDQTRVATVQIRTMAAQLGHVEALAGLCRFVDDVPMCTFAFDPFIAAGSCDTDDTCAATARTLEPCEKNDGVDASETEAHVSEVDDSKSCWGKCNDGHYWFVMCTDSNVVTSSRFQRWGGSSRHTTGR